MEFRKVGMLPIQKRVTQLQLNHVFNIVHGDAPNYLKSNFNHVHNRHNFNTRSSELSFTIPTVKTNLGKTTFYYTGIKAWNALPSALQNITNKTNFKKSIKSYFMEDILLEEHNVFTI